MTITELEAAGVLEGLSDEFTEAWADRDTIDCPASHLSRDAVQMVREGTSPREALVLVGFARRDKVAPSASFRHIREYWVLQTKRGPRAYYYSTLAGRTMPIKYAVAELLGATGQAEQIDKPAFLTSKLPF